MEWFHIATIILVLGSILLHILIVVSPAAEKFFMRDPILRHVLKARRKRLDDLKKDGE